MLTLLRTVNTRLIYNSRTYFPAVMVVVVVRGEGGLEQGVKPLPPSYSLLWSVVGALQQQQNLVKCRW